MVHGSQDLYSTFLQHQLGFSVKKTTVTTVVANLGAILGGAVIGHMSTFFGRGFSIIFSALFGAMILPETLVRIGTGNKGPTNLWKRWIEQEPTVQLLSKAHFLNECFL